MHLQTISSKIVVFLQWSNILRFPDTILFSSVAFDGISILSPWFAIIITVP
jgi:hypothetical protein